MMRIASYWAGTRRLANPYTVVLFAFAAQGTAALAQTPRQVTVRVTGDTMMRVDSSRVATTGPWLMLPIRKIDSLVRVQDTMTIGSPEYVRVNNELRALIQASAPRDIAFIKTDTGFSIIQLGPIAAGQASRTPFAAPRMATKRMDLSPRGWLGIKTDGLFAEPWQETDGVYIRYFVYPVVVEIQPNSPAAKTGVQFGDSLLAYDGLDLRSNNINLTRMLEPGRQLKVRLRRDGETKDVSITPEWIPAEVAREREVTAVAKMLVPSRAPMMMGADSTDRRLVERAATAGGQGFGVTRATSKVPMARMTMKGMFDASMTDLEPAAVLVLTQQKESHGVLVTEVPPGSLAAQIGLRGGDMIITVDDVAITSLLQLHREVMTRSSNKSTQFVVVRAGKIERLTYEPR